MRSTSRVILFIYGAIMIVAAIIGITLRVEVNLGNMDMDSLSFAPGAFGATEIILSVLIILYGLLLFVMAIMTVIMIIMRFNSNLLREEGYLMHTLPVPTWALVLSKLIVAVIWMVIAAVVAVASGLIIGLGSGMVGYILRQEGLIEVLKGFFRMFDASVVQLIVATAIFTVMMILHFYFSLAVGNIANRNKILLAVGVFIAARIVISIVSTIVEGPLFSVFRYDGINWSGLMTSSMIVDGIFAVLFFFGTTLLLRKRLNLA